MPARGFPAPIRRVECTRDSKPSAVRLSDLGHCALQRVAASRRAWHGIGQLLSTRVQRLAGFVAGGVHDIRKACPQKRPSGGDQSPCVTSKWGIFRALRLPPLDLATVVRAVPAAGGGRDCIRRWKPSADADPKPGTHRGKTGVAGIQLCPAITSLA